jgi:uncharacterized protein
MAERIERVLQGSEAEIREFLMSAELWGRTESIVYGAGISAQSWEAQRDIENAFSALGEWQMACGCANPDVVNWVTFYGQRLQPTQPPVGGQMARPGGPDHAGRPVVPWGLRDVWLGIVAVAVLYGAGYGLTYLAARMSARVNPDLWMALVPTLLELLFLVPVWWFVMHKRGGSVKTLGFKGFRPWVLGMGVGLLFAYFMFSGIYAQLLSMFDLQVQTDLTPVARQLTAPWLLVIPLVIVAPLVEEVFFRGFVFAGLRSRMDWRWAAVISAALFAGAHLELTFFLPAFLLGFLFAYLYQTSNSVWPGIAVHATVNTLAMVVLYVQL